MKPLQTLLLCAMVLLPVACSDSGSSENAGHTQVRVQLNWVPEPEFGGFYAAEAGGSFRNAGLNVQLIPGAVNTPAGQLVARGSVEIGVVSAEEVLTLTEQGAELVALFTTFQRSPFVLVVRADSPWQSLEELWRSKARAAVEPGLPWIAELDRKLGGHALELVPYSGQLAPFAAGAVDATQGFIASEPVQLRLQGIAVRTFSLGDSGYDPYAQVVVCSRAWLQAHTSEATAFVRALRAGWNVYNTDPRSTNAILAKLNPAMSREAMDIAAEVQLPLITAQGAGAAQVGWMTRERWATLGAQMLAAGKLKRAPADADALFVNLH